MTFSQNATNNQPTKCFPLPIAKQIAKDLLSGDSAKAQLFLTEKQLFETEKKSEMKDSVISLLRIKEDNYISIIDAHNQKFTTLESHTKKLEWDLKKEKVKGKFVTFLSSGIIATLTYIIITR